MSSAPQNQSPKTQNAPSSNQDKPAQAGNNIKKDEDRMKNEGGNCCSSDKNSNQSGTK